MAQRRRKVIKKKDNTFNKYLIIFFIGALFVYFLILPNIRIISIVLCILFVICVLGYWKILKFREAVNVKIFRRQTKEEEEFEDDDTVQISKPNGKKIIEATVMPLDLKKVTTEDLTEELIRRKEIKFRGQ